MLVTVLAPEILLAKNVGDLTAVKLDLKELQDWAAKDGVPWTRTHSLFANMGGFVIRRSSPERAVTTTSPEAETAPLEQNPTESKNPSIAEHGLSADASSQPVLIHLLTQDIVLLRSKGLLPKLPYITLEEINDKSKSDSLVRVITVVQIIWIVIQTIARAFRSLAISQLEVAVIAFAICAIIIYGINWEKPKGVQVPITIISYPGPFPKDTIKIVESDREAANNLFTLLIMFLELLFTCGADSDSVKKWPLGKPISNAYNREVPWIMDTVGFSKGDIFGLFLGTTVFSAVHIAAWNFVFPTPVESLLWKIAAVLCTTMGLVFGGGIVILAYLSNKSLGYIDEKYIIELLVPIAFLLLVVSYVVCRLFLVVEIFRCLCFLPPSAYVATWATNVPHVA
jgi:hypothetical protein